MKNYKFALILISALTTNILVAEEELEEVVVTSSFVDQILSDIENPLHIVNGDNISSSASQSLGESIDDLLGVYSTDFGSGVGQPVIRGMSGSRVKVLNNGMVMRDVSGLGADHINDIDLNNIQQIEIVRGPSSLLYSNGSIGGIVNIVDNTIARVDFIKPEMRLGAESQSVNDGDAYNFSFQNNIGGLNLSLAYKDLQFGNFDIPHGAVIHREEEHHDDDHDEDHHEEEEDHEEHEEDMRFLANSDFESKSRRIGISKTGDWGYFGVSSNKVESLYGIPFHGEGHDEHGHEEDHDEDGHDEDGHDEEGHEDERIFSTTNSDILNLEGSYTLNNSLVKEISYFFRDTDYSLMEQHAEAEEEHEEDGHEDEHHSEGPTEFKNIAKEYGAIFDLSNDNLLQKMVINIVSEDVSIIGAEAFMNPSDNKENSFGYYISKQLNRAHLDFGIRHDRISRAGSLSHEEHGHDEDHDEDGHEEEEHEEEMEYFDRDINNTSLALSLGADINDNLDVSFGYARVERAPSAVELFMNGPHLATSRFEVGNTTLDSETSNNVDITFKYQNEGFFGEFTYFRNDVDNYIYLRDETEEEHEEHEEEHEEHEEEHGDHEGLILANYLQRDAEIRGYEFQFGRTMDLARGTLTLSFGRDSLLGEFKDGSNIPRIVPARNIYSISYSENDLELKLSLKDVQKQDDIAESETKTEGYDMLDLRINKTYSLNNDSDFSFSLFAKNLLDEAARNHSSFVKDEVPLPGRNYGIKFNYKF
tara:strand:+ start:4406 stop:6682 length:2277 start_codon:yes stop_codon:yes gene_type:complete